MDAMGRKGNDLLLEIKGLKTHFSTEDGIVRAVDDISLAIHEGTTLGLVGESGCGKSMTALSIMRLIPHPGKIMGGEIRFTGRGNLLSLTNAEMRNIRGNEISMIFQEPMTCLNPVYRIGDQIAESVKRHQKVSRREALNRAVEMLKLVSMPSPERRIRDYPHQLSGGMRQRAMIAMALSCNSKLLLADEPTTALDVTIQAQILDLMNKLKEETGASILLISHNLGVIAETAQYVCVMYAGVVVESAGVRELFAKPLHPYTVGLLKSVPRMDEDTEEEYVELSTIPGAVPDLLALPSGCRFSDRCTHRREMCDRSEPPLEEVEAGRLVRCWLYAEAQRQ